MRPRHSSTEYPVTSEAFGFTYSILPARFVMITAMGLFSRAPRRGMLSSIARFVVPNRATPSLAETPAGPSVREGAPGCGCEVLVEATTQPAYHGPARLDARAAAGKTRTRNERCEARPAQGGDATYDAPGWVSGGASPSNSMAGQTRANFTLAVW